MRLRDLEAARTGILGVAREGQAVWRQLRNLFPRKQLALYAETAAEDGFIRQLDNTVDVYCPGPFDVDRLRGHDVLVRSAGVSPYREELRQLRSEGVQFTTASNLWFAENPVGKIICVSGTKGKSTTAALLAYLLECSGFTTRLAGNIGKPMLDCDQRGVDYWVIELSSYQITDLEARPDFAVLLNLSDEHVDWHGGAHRYREDKLRLAELVGKGGLIVNRADPVLGERFSNADAVTWFDHADGWRPENRGVTFRGTTMVTAPPSLPGEHNLQNLAAVMTVIDRLGVRVTGLDHALGSFKGLPHRLQVIGERSGVSYVDDSISTTPVSVIAALRTLGHEGVVLLLGGMDRGLDWQAFAAWLVDRPPHAVVTLPDNGPQILDCLVAAGVQPPLGMHAAHDLSEAMSLARRLAPTQGYILLSPGAPSFPQFRDFAERGERFAEYAGLT